MINAGRLINIIFIASFLVVIVGALLRYQFVKEYTFTIETSCDSAIELCFTRDCEEEECPPNSFEDYRVFDIHAYDFNSCEHDGCEAFCKEQGGCVETICDPDNEDSCSGTL